MSQTIPASRKLLYAVLAASFVLLLIEGALSSIRAVRTAAGHTLMEEMKHTEYDAELGWVNLKNFHVEDFYDEGQSYTTNGQRLRAVDGDYTAEPRDGRYRIIALGDSFTMGYGVGDPDTYPSRLAEAVPGAEVINMGLGGYGVGQDYLWYLRERDHLSADLLLLAFIPHDFQRMASREFLGYPKPRVYVEDGELARENIPVPRSWNRRLWAERAGMFTDRLALAAAFKKLLGFAIPTPDAEAVPVADFAPTAEAIFLDLDRRSRESGQAFALVLLATHWEQDPALGEWLRSFSSRSGIPLIDLAAAFAPIPEGERNGLFLPGNFHYTTEGNRRAAAVIASEARAKIPAFPAAQ